MQSLDLRRTFKHNVVFLDSEAEHQAFAVGVCSVYSEVICLISLCVGSVVMSVVVIVLLFACSVFVVPSLIALCSWGLLVVV